MSVEESKEEVRVELKSDTDNKFVRVQPQPLMATRNICGEVDELKTKMDSVTKMILAIDGSAIRFIDNPTDEEIDIALKQDLYAVRYLPEKRQTFEMWVKAADQEGSYNVIFDDINNTKFDSSAQIKIYDAMIKANINDIEKFYVKINGSGYVYSLWETIISNLSYLQYSTFRLCPWYAQSALIDKAMEVSREYLTYAQSELWTFDRVYAYVESCPENISLAEERADPGMFVYEHKVGIYKHALDYCNARYVANEVLDNIDPDVINNITSYETLLLSKNWKYVVAYRGPEFIMNREKAELILRKFTIASLVDEVRDHDKLKDIVRLMPLLQRIHYKRELKRELKKDSIYRKDNIDD